MSADKKTLWYGESKIILPYDSGIHTIGSIGANKQPDDVDLLYQARGGDLYGQLEDVFNFYYLLKKNNSHLGLAICPQKAFQPDNTFIVGQTTNSPIVPVHSLSFHGLEGLESENPRDFFQKYKHLFSEGTLDPREVEFFYIVYNSLIGAFSTYPDELLYKKFISTKSYLQKNFKDLYNSNFFSKLEGLIFDRS